MADETRFCTGCGAPLKLDGDYCAKCGRKWIELSPETSATAESIQTQEEADTGNAAPASTFIVFGNAVIPTAEEVAQYEASQSHEPPPLNIYDWIFTPLEAWERRPDALRPGGWAWYGGLCGMGAVLALLVLGLVSRSLTQRVATQSPNAGRGPSVLGASSVTGPALASAPALTPPSVASVPYTPPSPTIVKVAPLYRIENGHYAALTVEEERQAARDAVAWREQGQLSSATRQTDILIQAAQRQEPRSVSSAATSKVDVAEATR